MTPRQKVTARYREKNRDTLRAKNLKYYKNNSEYFEKYRKQYKVDHPNKVRAQSILNQGVVAGRLKRQPCFVCGDKAEAHHPSYELPLDVTWLCRKHHKEVHIR